MKALSPPLLPPLLEYLSLQAAGGAAFSGAALLVAVIAVIVCVAVLVVMRRRLSAASAAAPATAATGAPLGAGAPPLDPSIGRDITRIDGELRSARDRLDALSTSMPHIGEVDEVKKGMDRLCSDFARLGTDLNDKMEAFRRSAAEDLDKARLAMEKAALEKVVARASVLLEKNGVPRSEFDVLRERFDRMHGADEAEERMAVLSRLFDSDRIKVLNWQCRLIRLLRGGLAPDAEQDLIVSEGIPESSLKKFLKRLVDEGVAESRPVQAYYMDPGHEWIYTYVERPDWLQRRLQGTVKKEADYQRYIAANVGLVEDGLILEDTEYVLDTGRLDLVCRDSSGRAVGIELKYPAAAVRDKRQVASYRDDYRRKSGMPGSRFMLVAPSIPGDLKRLLEEDGIEHREIQLGGTGAAEAGSEGGGGSNDGGAGANGGANGGGAPGAASEALAA